MNSIERVRAALTFSEPDRVPVMNISKNYLELLRHSDVFPMALSASKSWMPGHGETEIGLFPKPIDPFYRWKEPAWVNEPKYKQIRQDTHELIDEWGCIWNVSPHINNMGHPGRPSLPDWDALDDYMIKYFPDPTEAHRYRMFNRLGKIFGKKKYRMGIFGDGPFSIAANMRGFAHFLADHIRNPKKVTYLLDQIVEYFITVMKIWKSTGDVHGFMIYDDLGEQDRPYMSVKMFDKFYENVYGRLYSAAHDLGCEFHHHSCGKVVKLIPSLIKWGVDALEFDSPRMNGYLELEPYRGKIMFWGCVNIQSIYPKGTVDEVSREVRCMIRNLGTSSGGFGAYFYDNWKDIEVPKANTRAFKNGLKKYGIYAKIPPTWWTRSFPETKEGNDNSYNTQVKQKT
ncbi:MAG: uroporphyrinogen decarboxylase family protein [Promethearchaeota archaeon]